MSSDNVRQIYALYRELHAVLSPSNSSAPQNKEDYNKFAAIISRQDILQTKMPFDEPTLIARTSAYLNANKTAGELGEFRRLYESLKACTDRKKTVAILSFLLLSVEGGGAEKASIPPANSTRLASNSGSASSRNSQQNSITGNHVPTSYAPVRFDNLELCRKSQAPSSATICESIQKTEQKHSLDSKQPELVQDVLYSFSGIQGHYLRKDVSGDFKLDPKTTMNLNPSQASTMLRLSELGYFHNQIVQLVDPKGGRGPLGLLGQGLVTMILADLTDYYGFVAMLQDENNEDRDCNRIATKPPLTLFKLIMLYVEPLHRLQWIARIIEACQTKKGGELASAVAVFRSSGSPKVQALANQMLSAVCGPLLKMLSKWLLEGEINDPHAEFFIETLPEVGVDRLWSDKYRVRKAMLPNFISAELANNILVTGKSVNFLREVCNDETPVKGREELRVCFEECGDDIFEPVPETKLHMLIETIYLNTSKQVLNIVMGPHKLLMHLQAMRNYLLLGQGDFADILIANLKSELDRPAKELHRHELSSVLEMAIRSTNAQYVDPEILAQLAVYLMGDFEDDLGWDTFTLKYTVNGPLSTMLEQSMMKYQKLFRQLWRMKHVELVLSSRIWKEQISNAKLLRKLQPELDATTRNLNLLSSQMVHFIHQMQYYISYEVIECLWSRMLERIRKATDLDTIFVAHDDFLTQVKVNLFMENEEIYISMDNVLKSIFQLELWQQTFYRLCMNELDARNDMETNIKLSERKGQFGLTSEQMAMRDTEKNTFTLAIKRCHMDLEKMTIEYERYVRIFLFKLTSSYDENTQMFGTRLDFNEYYKKRDQRLADPLTFAKLRQSTAYNTRMSVSHSTLQFDLKN